jgi:hypothetical protein
MGVLIQEQFSTNFGVQLQGVYCSIRGSYTIRKNGDNYIVYSNAGIWADKNSYTNGKECLTRGIIIEKSFDLQQLNAVENMFSVLYEELKQKLGYQNYVDDM